MDFQHPFRTVGLSLEGDILAFLARTEKPFSGREVQRAVGASQDATRVALQRLAAQGVVVAEPGGGRAILYQLNRDHLAARYIEGIALIRLELIQRLREEIASWKVKPSAAVIFGSVARGEASASSDLDLLIIRPRRTDADDEAWQEQLSRLADSATRWTGNDARVLEYGEDELMELFGQEPVLDAAAEDGLDLGSTPFRRLWKKPSTA